jgi:hypothetical protein
MPKSTPHTPPNIRRVTRLFGLGFCTISFSFMLQNHTHHWIQIERPKFQIGLADIVYVRKQFILVHIDQYVLCLDAFQAGQK